MVRGSGYKVAQFGGMLYIKGRINIREQDKHIGIWEQKLLGVKEGDVIGLDGWVD
jgi:hypothetical protein